VRHRITRAHVCHKGRSASGNAHVSETWALVGYLSISPRLGWPTAMAQPNHYMHAIEVALRLCMIMGSLGMWDVSLHAQSAAGLLVFASLASCQSYSQQCGLRGMGHVTGVTLSCGSKCDVSAGPTHSRGWSNSP
jgi:hypothetical protein